MEFIGDGYFIIRCFERSAAWRSVMRKRCPRFPHRDSLSISTKTIALFFMLEGDTGFDYRLLFCSAYMICILIVIEIKIAHKLQ